jgi:hypothetical protein
MSGRPSNSSKLALIHRIQKLAPGQHASNSPTNSQAVQSTQSSFSAQCALRQPLQLHCNTLICPSCLLHCKSQVTTRMCISHAHVFTQRANSWKPCSNLHQTPLTNSFRPCCLRAVCVAKLCSHMMIITYTISL